MNVAPTFLLLWCKDVLELKGLSAENVREWSCQFEETRNMDSFKKSNFGIVSIPLFDVCRIEMRYKCDYHQMILCHKPIWRVH